MGDGGWAVKCILTVSGAAPWRGGGRAQGAGAAAAAICTWQRLAYLPVLTYPNPSLSRTLVTLFETFYHWTQFFAILTYLQCEIILNAFWLHVHTAFWRKLYAPQTTAITWGHCFFYWSTAMWLRTEVFQKQNPSFVYTFTVLCIKSSSAKKKKIGKKSMLTYQRKVLTGVRHQNFPYIHIPWYSLKQIYCKFYKKLPNHAIYNKQIH